MISGREEFERFWDKKSRAFENAFLDLARSRLALGADYQSSVSKLAELIRHTMILSNLYARRRVLLEADRMRRIARFATQPVDVVPDVTFDEAIEDLVSREPRLARTWEEVSRLYSTEHVFAAVRSIDENMTARIQKALADVTAKGGSINDAVRVFQEIAPWSRSYSEMVYRTNLSTAYNAGRMQQANDPEVKDAIPALVFESMDDDRTRPNHKAADGLIAAADDPIWKRYHPPAGYGCRCSVNFVSRLELERRGLIDEQGNVKAYYPPNFAAAGPDPGFRPGGMEWGG